MKTQAERKTIARTDDYDPDYDPCTAAKERDFEARERIAHAIVAAVRAVERAEEALVGSLADPAMWQKADATESRVEVTVALRLLRAAFVRQNAGEY
jgi:hypothetical protein